MIGYFQTEQSALDCERDWIGDLRTSLTNIANGGVVQDPEESAKAAFRLMLARATPLSQWRKPTRCQLPADQALALYAMTLDHIRREIESPTPPYLLVSSNGEVRAAWR